MKYLLVTLLSLITLTGQAQDPFASSSSKGVAYTRSSIFMPTTTSPGSVTVNLPTNQAGIVQEGFYEMYVQYKVNGSDDHVMAQVFQVIYRNAGANKTLLTQPIGATAKASGSSFGLGSLTASNPTQAGVVTIGGSWGDGGAKAAGVLVSFRYMCAW